MKGISLKPFNTFGIEAKAAAFAEVSSIEELKSVLPQNRRPIYLLGGGSNILLTKDYYDWLFLKNNFRGFQISDSLQNTEGVQNSKFEIRNLKLVEIGGGESWHSFVLWAIENDLAGVENLSLIPGTVGAAPIQNIGAYGVELKDVFVGLEAIDLQTYQSQWFTKEDCLFGYRDSIFKNNLKGRYFISKVVLKLQDLKITQQKSQMSSPQYSLKIEYGDIKKTLSDMRVEHPTIRDVSTAIIQIRQSKLPDPSLIGNAGSFFKNPTIASADFEKLKITYPNIVGYPNTEGGVKAAAAWLIEQCGWKGYRSGQVGVHERQALVLVNYGGGRGSEIQALAGQIQASVLGKFGISLISEVNMI